VADLRASNWLQGPQPLLRWHAPRAFVSSDRLKAPGSLSDKTDSPRYTPAAYWLSGRVVMQRPAKPCTSVRFRAQPPPPRPRNCASILGSHFTRHSGNSKPFRAPHRAQCHICPGGETGIRKGLKIPRLRPCGFDSRPGHHTQIAPLGSCPPRDAVRHRGGRLARQTRWTRVR
jgi:hypothetical protein